MLDVVWKASEAIDLRFSGGRSYRAPTFNELYWPYEDFGGGYSYQGNPNLKPEVAWSGEVGLDFHPGAFSLSANASARYVSDLIEDSTDSNSIRSTSIPPSSPTLRSRRLTRSVRRLSRHITSSLPPRSFERADHLGRCRADELLAAQGGSVGGFHVRSRRGGSLRPTTGAIGRIPTAIH